MSADASPPSNAYIGRTLIRTYRGERNVPVPQEIRTPRQPMRCLDVPRPSAPLTAIVNGRSLQGPYPPGTAKVVFGLGCFWGAGAQVMEHRGVWVTDGRLWGGPHAQSRPTRRLFGRTGHNEVVLVVYDPAKVSFEILLKTFWESHDPTQGIRQGNDVGTQYRSGIYLEDETQRAAALASSRLRARSQDPWLWSDHDRDRRPRGLSTRRGLPSANLAKNRPAIAVWGDWRRLARSERESWPRRVDRAIASMRSASRAVIASHEACATRL